MVNVRQIFLNYWLFLGHFSLGQLAKSVPLFFFTHEYGNNSYVFSLINLTMQFFFCIQLLLIIKQILQSNMAS